MATYIHISKIVHAPRIAVRRVHISVGADWSFHSFKSHHAAAIDANVLFIEQ